MEQRKLEDILFTYGIDTYLMSILTNLPAVGEAVNPIAKQIPQQVGLIYGLSTYTDTVSPTNQTLISSADAENIYLTFKDGPTEFYQPQRMDSLIFKSAGFPNNNPNNYLPVFIQGNFDLSTSFYANPTAVISKTIMLNLHYISTESYVALMEKGVVLDDANRFLKGKRK